MKEMVGDMVADYLSVNACEKHFEKCYYARGEPCLG